MASLFAGVAEAQDTSAGWCSYPRLPPKQATESRRTAFWIKTPEKEPNNSRQTAQPIPLGRGDGQDPDIDVTGSLRRMSSGAGEDYDVYSFSADAGDILGFACIGLQRLDPVVELFDQSGPDPILKNNDHKNIALHLPRNTDFPVAATPYDSAGIYTFSSKGTYYILVRGHYKSTGQYTLQLRLRRPYMESQKIGEFQKVFVDFDGATIDARQVFSLGSGGSTRLSPLSDFLPAWGLDKNDLQALQDNIIERLISTYTPLDTAHVEFTDKPSSDKHVSRIIIGGTSSQLSNYEGLGLSENIDPGNYNTNDQAIVLLDKLSAPAGKVTSINSIDNTDTKEKKIDAVAATIANLAAHELGHNLGIFHCFPGNSTRSMMDSGTVEFIQNSLDAWPFVNDEYDYAEGYATAKSIQPVNNTISWSLTVGQLSDTTYRTKLEHDLLLDELLAAKGGAKALSDPTLARTWNDLYSSSSLDDLDQLSSTDTHAVAKYSANLSEYLRHLTSSMSPRPVRVVSAGGWKNPGTIVEAGHVETPYEYEAKQLLLMMPRQMFFELCAEAGISYEDSSVLMDLILQASGHENTWEKFSVDDDQEP